MNMQSAQVNQMTLQLREKIAGIKQLYSMDEQILNQMLSQVEGFEEHKHLIKYQDLISTQDIEFWDYLCLKDFKRLQKLQAASLGDGHFMDDSDSSDSEQEGKPLRRNQRQDSDEEDDQDNIMDRMLNDIQQLQEEHSYNDEILKKELEDQLEKEKEEQALKDAEYGNNQFWDNNKSDNQYDIDNLMDDYQD